MKVSKYNIIHNINGEFYFYNSLTKAVLRLGNCIAEPYKLESADIDELIQIFGKTELESLYKNGFIVDDDYNERKVLEYAYRKHFFNSSNLTLILVPTFECNFACPYCFEETQRSKKASNIYFSV